MNTIEERDDDDLDRASGDAQSKGSKADDEEKGLPDSREPSESKLLQVEVSILDIDRKSVNLDEDSDEEARRK